MCLFCIKLGTSIMEMEIWYLFLTSNSNFRRGKIFPFISEFSNQQFNSFTKCLQNIFCFFFINEIGFFCFCTIICTDTQTLFHFNFDHENFIVDFHRLLFLNWHAIFKWNNKLNRPKPNGIHVMCSTQLNFN